MASAVICLATGRKINFSTYIFDNMVRNVGSPSKFMMYLWFLQAIIDAQVDDMSSHNNQYTSLSLTQKVFANMCRVGKRFSGVETPLFATMLVQPQPPAVEEEDEVELEQDKITQALEILKLKKRVKKLEKKRRSKSSGLKRLRKVDSKDVSAAEPIVFDDEEVGMTMAQTLIKMKAEKARLLDEQMAKRLHDEEVEKAVAKEKQEKDDFEKAKGLQQQKCQSLKRKPVSIAQAKKNMIIYLKNMAGYKMEHFRGMTYDKVKYPLIDWEIHSEGSRTYWKIIRVGRITEAYQSFKDMLKGFVKEDLVAL
nr:hypothetical protein [Tanacetum cinerariifolium]